MWFLLTQIGRPFWCISCMYEHIFVFMPFFIYKICTDFIQTKKGELEQNIFYLWIIRMFCYHPARKVVILFGKGTWVFKKKTFYRFCAQSFVNNIELVIANKISLTCFCCPISFATWHKECQEDFIRLYCAILKLLNTTLMSHFAVFKDNNLFWVIVQEYTLFNVKWCWIWTMMEYTFWFLQDDFVTVTVHTSLRRKGAFWIQIRLNTYRCQGNIREFDYLFVVVQIRLRPLCHITTIKHVHIKPWCFLFSKLKRLQHITGSKHLTCLHVTMSTSKNGG